MMTRKRRESASAPYKTNRFFSKKSNDLDQTFKAMKSIMFMN